MIRHTSYRTTVWQNHRSVDAEFCMKEGLPWPCDTELRDRELATVVQQRDLAEARVGDLRTALADEQERNSLYLATLDAMNAQVATLRAALGETP